MMNAQEKRNLKNWVETRKKAGPVLEAIRNQEIRETDTSVLIKRTAGLVTNQLKQHDARHASGLVEQQRMFRKRNHAGTGK